MTDAELTALAAESRRLKWNAYMREYSRGKRIEQRQALLDGLEYHEGPTGKIYRFRKNIPEKSVKTAK